MPIRLLDALRDFRSAWPRDRFMRDSAVVIGDEPELLDWLEEMSQILKVDDIRYGADGDTVSLRAQLIIENLISGPSDSDGPRPFPIGLRSLPDITFSLLDTGPASLARIFVGLDDSGVSLVAEAVPLQISLPTGMVRPGAYDKGLFPPDRTVGGFEAGILDSLQIDYRENEPTTVRVHARVELDAELRARLLPVVPISFDDCRFLGLPCESVHDFGFIPSGAIARRYLEWLRHDIGSADDGFVYARSVIFGTAQREGKDVAERAVLDPDQQAELSITDVVVPLGSALPIPTHYTAALQRQAVSAENVDAYLQYERMGAAILLLAKPETTLVLRRLVLESVPDPRSPLPDEGEPPPEIPTVEPSMEAALVFGSRESEPSEALSLAFEEQGTIVAGFERERGAAGRSVLDFRLGGIDVSVIGIHAGYSVGKVADPEVSATDFGSVTMFVLDLHLRGASDRFLVLEGVGGEPIDVVVERVGWKLGSFSLEGLALPDGVQLRVGPFRVIFREVGLITSTEGGHYLYFDGGLAFPLPKGSKGDLTFRRMRFRIAGSETAPSFGIDGFNLHLDFPSASIEVGGHWVDRTEGTDHIEELALRGTLEGEVGPRAFTLGVDVVAGHVTGTDDFRYWLVHAVLPTPMPLGGFELRSIHVLEADDMVPALSDADRTAEDLRYFAWQRRTHPLSIGNDRRLDAWQRSAGHWAAGVGFDGTLTFLGELALFRMFFLFVNDDGDENVFLLSGEVLFLESDDAIGYAVIEWDGADDRFAASVGVRLTAAHFMNNPPDFLLNGPALTGTLLFSNSPLSFAIGRLDDPMTWLRFRTDVSFWGAESLLEVSFCFEWVDDGPKGMALAVRQRGAVRLPLHIGRAELYAGFGISALPVVTGSSAAAVAAWIEVGLKFVLFGFLDIGLSVRADTRWAGTDPTYLSMSMAFRIDTPWWLPDVSFRLEHTQGALEPERLSTSTGGLSRASAHAAGSEETTSLFIWDPALLGAEGTKPPVFSIEALRDRPELERSARWQAFDDSDPTPIATASELHIGFSVPVDDRAAVAAERPGATAPQGGPDLQLRYELIGFAVRRRPRFEAAPWVTVCEREEVTPELIAGEVIVSDSVPPPPINAYWDQLRVDGALAGKLLLLNSHTPFSIDRDPLADEELLDDNPDWPCCPRKRKPSPSRYQLTFHDEPLGDPLRSPIRFPATGTTFHTARPADLRIAHFAGGGLPAGTPAARFAAGASGVLFRVVFDEPAADAAVRLSWPSQPAKGTLVLSSIDAAGATVSQASWPVSELHEPVVHRLAGDRPLARVEARVVVPAGPALLPAAPPFVEVDWLAYTSWRSAADEALIAARCADGAKGFDANGVLVFLPNHDYEIEFRTRITASHPSTDDASVEVPQYVYFRTKAHAGLNAAPRIGDEVEPMLETTYPRPDTPLYRTEPIAIGFDERYGAVLPLSLRPPDAGIDERTEFLELGLVARPDVATVEPAPATATSEDWFDAHAGSPFVHALGWRVGETDRRGRQTATADPRRVRLAALVHRPGASCTVPDPLVAPSSVFVQAPPEIEGTRRWPASARYIASIVETGAPFVDRDRFAATDRWALSVLGGGDTPTWTVEDGRLEVDSADATVAAFGETTWHRAAIDVGVSGAGAAGVAVGLPAAGMDAGLCALIERDGPDRFVAIRRLSPGGQLDLVERRALPTDLETPVALQVCAFDDKLRARAGELVVEGDRGATREGRFGLVAQGDAAFHSLHVGPIPVCQAPVVTSRYGDFAEHMASFRTPAAVATLGDAASSDVDALWAETRDRIAEAMSPGADPGARQTLFDDWTRSLAWPLLSNVARLEITRLVETGATRAFLLESPEPLRFSDEIAVWAERRRRRPVFPGATDVLDVRFTEAGARVELPPGSRLLGRRLVVVRRATGPETEDQLLVSDRPAHGDVAFARPLSRALSDGPVRLPPIPPSDPQAGGITVIDTVGEVVVDVPPVPPDDEHIRVAALTDRDERRALLIPLSADAPRSLASGRYRLQFELTRTRWRSSDSDPDAQLTSSAHIDLAW